ncbi:MAG: hypothetical protein IPH30_07155 [Betaproteobacteria bacterium]|nr:hypothetical protein [Betaproteobacteria bacterium]
MKTSTALMRSSRGSSACARAVPALPAKAQSPMHTTAAWNAALRLLEASLPR